MRHVVLSLLCLAAVIAYVQRLGVNTLKQPLSGHFQIDTEEFGALGSAWLLGYAVMQVPVGWLADRFGGRNVLVALALAWSALTAAVGWCPNFNVLLLVWTGMGMAMAGVFPCAAKSIGAWFPDTEKATASGLLGSSTMLGVAAASVLTAWLVYAAGLPWQTTYLLYGSAGVLWAGAYAALVPERAGTRPAAAAIAGGDWHRLVTSPSLWLLCAQQFFRAGAMIFFINWFPAFLKEARQFSEYDAGRYAGAVGTAALIGGTTGGFFSDWLFRRTGLRRLSRQGVAVVGMAAAGAIVLVSNFIADDRLAVALFGFGAFVASFGGVAGYTVAIELGGRRIGIVFSLMNMAGNFGGAIVNYAAGALTQRTQSWDAALFVVAAIFAVDAVCWALLNPRGTLFEEKTYGPS
jgi:nitrate/nitrite transporter NarK